MCFLSLSLSVPIHSSVCWMLFCWNFSETERWYSVRSDTATYLCHSRIYIYEHFWCNARHKLTWQLMLCTYQVHCWTSRGMWLHQQLRWCLTKVTYLIFNGLQKRALTHISNITQQGLWKEENWLHNNISGLREICRQWTGRSLLRDLLSVKSVERKQGDTLEKNYSHRSLWTVGWEKLLKRHP